MADRIFCQVTSHKKIKDLCGKYCKGRSKVKRVTNPRSPWRLPGRFIPPAHNAQPPSDAVPDVGATSKQVASFLSNGATASAVKGPASVWAARSGASVLADAPKVHGSSAVLSQLEPLVKV
jgi:hypothetical protein